MNKKFKALNKSTKIMIIFISLAVIFALAAIIIHFSTRVTDKSYEACALGDVNGDGYISSLDAKLIMEFTSGEGELFDSQKAIADVNKDNKVDKKDALILLDFATGKRKSLTETNTPVKNDKDKEDNNKNKTVFTDESFYSEVEIVNQWVNEDKTNSYQLNLTVKNLTDREIDGWKTHIVLNNSTELSKNWNCYCSIDEKTITLEGFDLVPQSAAVCGVIVTSSESISSESLETIEIESE